MHSYLFVLLLKNTSIAPIKIVYKSHVSSLITTSTNPPSIDSIPTNVFSSKSHQVIFEIQPNTKLLYTSIASL